MVRDADVPRGSSTLGQGALAPQIHLLPQIQKLADKFWRDF